jgi:predicted acylesterase/phospholipase RssA
MKFNGHAPFLLRLNLCVLLFTSTFTSHASANLTKKFKRAVVFSGKSLNTAIFMGMYDAAEDAGKPIDLVIGACGGSVGAALVHTEPNRSARLQFLKSLSYYQALKTVELSEINFFEFLSIMRWQKLAAYRNMNVRVNERLVLPNWFNFSLVKVPQAINGLEKFQTPFNSNGTRIVLLAARATFAVPKTEQSIPGKKLFKEVYFTDAELAQQLQNMKSFIGTTYPNSTVEENIEVQTTETVMQAVRAGIADPIYVGPGKIGDQNYFSGGVDLDPVPLAKELAQEVIAAYPVPFESSVEVPLLKALYSYQPNDYVRRIVLAGNDHWVDFSDSAFPNLSPGRQTNFSNAWAQKELGRSIQIGSSIPANYIDYVDAVQKQYNYGYERTKEALNLKTKTLKHIRRPFMMVMEN